MLTGFALASYAIVANDSIQTLGTFLSSNSNKKWWLLWLYAGGILTFTLYYGWYTHNGDPSFGRLSRIPLPVLTWVHILPPLALLILTRVGYPVSTTFLVLTIFVQKDLGSMVTKSISGYFLAFIVGFIIYFLTRKLYEKFFLNKEAKPPSNGWYIAQTLSTGFLWSQWLIQDLANIYVYLPRKLGFLEITMSLILMLAIQALIFYNRGGDIQKIVTEKTSTHNIRSATIIDLIYAFILFYFKSVSNIPMSTTWVFLGLLGGRELAINTFIQLRSSRFVWPIIFKDLGKATVGMLASVAIALSLSLLTPESEAPPSGQKLQEPKEQPALHKSGTPTLPA